MGIAFILTSILMGFALAMDAFSVSIANGLTWPHMSRKRMYLIAGTYAFFQFAMPMIGWVCVHTATHYFTVFQKFIPWIALGLLALIGGNMIREGLKRETPGDEAAAKPQMLALGTLAVQGIATSIDALSVGFTIADYEAPSALTAALLIAATTFVICMIGLVFGKKFGERLADKATVIGGLILIAIGIEIFVKGVFFS
ncbi:MAG: manganese efflux pump [Lachnospiraceae bacterium]|nr:manganese efflux pump [Lachnospiraceae bacterium]